MRRYLVFLALFAALLIALVAAFNAVADPYGIHRLVVRPGFNLVKPGQQNHLRMEKAYVVRELRPRALILGSSRAENALRPDHPIFAAQPCYNLALSGASLREIHAYLRHAQFFAPVKEAVVGLDFFMAHAWYPSAPDFDEARLCTWFYPKDYTDTLLTLDAVNASILTLQSQKTATNFLFPNGMQNPDFRASTAPLPPQRALCQRIEGIFLEHTWHPKGKKDFAWSKPGETRTFFDELREMLEFARAHGIRLALYISPSHARIDQTLCEEGLWDFCEEWKRRIAGQCAEFGVPLWDFSGAFGFNTEPIPPATAPAGTMHWWAETSHFTPALGDVILSRLNGAAAPDFGEKITPENIDAHLARIREARDSYARTHPDDVAEVHAAAEKIHAAAKRAEAAEEP